MSGFKFSSPPAFGDLFQIFSNTYQINTNIIWVITKDHTLAKKGSPPTLQVIEEFPFGGLTP